MSKKVEDLKAGIKVVSDARDVWAYFLEAYGPNKTIQLCYEQTCHQVAAAEIVLERLINGAQ